MTETFPGVVVAALYALQDFPNLKPTGNPCWTVCCREVRGTLLLAAEGSTARLLVLEQE